MANNRRKSRPIWPFIVVALLASHVGGMMLIVSIAQRNKPPVVENYYQRALDWDKDRGVQAQR